MAEKKQAEWRLKGPITLDQFDVGVTLGTGSFGRVRLAVHKATKGVWAIKMLKKAEVIRMQQVRIACAHFKCRNSDIPCMVVGGAHAL